MSTSRPSKMVLRAAVLTAVFGAGIVIAILARSTRDLGRRPGTSEHRHSATKLPLPKNVVRARAVDPPTATAGGGTSFPIVDWITNVPILHASVTIERDDGRRQLEIEAGHFNLPPESKGSIHIVAEGYFPLASDVGELPPAGGPIHLVPLEPLAVQCLSAERLGPVAGAEVWAEAGGSDDVKAVSDAAGQARLEGLVFGLPPASDSAGERPEHRIRLTVVADGFLEKKARLAVRPGEPWGRVEVLLDPSRSFLLRVIESGSRSPIPQALAIHQWDYLGIMNASRGARPLATDERGEAFLAVREGARRIQVVVTHRDFATTGAVIDAVEALPPGERSTHELTMELEPGHEAEGVVLDEEGRGIARAVVDLDPVDRPDFTDWMRFAALGAFKHAPDVAATDEAGRFTFGRLRAGTYAVHLSHLDYWDDPEKPNLTVGQDTEPWVGVLRSGLTLSGTVMDDGGSSLQNAILTFFRLDASGHVPSGERLAAKAVRSGPDGLFSARGLTPDKYRLHASAGPGYKNRSEIVDAAAPREPFVIVLERREQRHGNGGGTLWLRFTAGEEWLIHGEASVVLYRPADVSRVASYMDKLEGSQLFWPAAPLGRFHAVASVKGYAPVVLPFLEVGASPDESLKLNIVPGIVASIEVPGSNAAPLVEVFEPFHGLKVFSDVLPAGAADRRALVRLLPGSYAVRLSADDGAKAEENLIVPAVAMREAPHLRIALEPRTADAPREQGSP